MGRGNPLRPYLLPNLSRLLALPRSCVKQIWPKGSARRDLMPQPLAIGQRAIVLRADLRDGRDRAPSPSTLRCRLHGQRYTPAASPASSTPARQSRS
ncbi:hypothetical protein CBM2589_B120374 [Cupriavidus taiwanensis]|uniref:Uncharacterized protein n=1 Tax=Cupriavidus taiwanensis TaxID=164546 RepID=A0A375BHD8_9BURK|nr:hypothetical protein CBM2589_B120374 [Cupriavidus taiwanensis]